MGCLHSGASPRLQPPSPDSPFVHYFALLGKSPWGHFLWPPLGRDVEPGFIDGVLSGAGPIVGAPPGSLGEMDRFRACVVPVARVIERRLRGALPDHPGDAFCSFGRGSGGAESDPEF